MKTALKNMTIFILLAWSVQTSALAATTVSFRVSCVIAPAIEMTTPNAAAEVSPSPSSYQDPSTETIEYRKTASGLVKFHSITAL